MSPLQVDGQRNRTGSSPGPLVGLNVFNQLFVGGYSEFTPELLPLGSRFRQGFQGETSLENHLRFPVPVGYFLYEFCLM